MVWLSINNLFVAVSVITKIISTHNKGWNVELGRFITCLDLCSQNLRHAHLGHFPFVRSVRSDQSVLKWNARVLRTGCGQKVLLMDQSRSVLSLCSAKVREFGVVHGGNICMCAPFLGQNKQVETDLRKPWI